LSNEAPDHATVQPERATRRRWVGPIVVLTSAALVLFAGFYSLDFYYASSPDASASNPLSHYLEFDSDHISDATASLAAMTAAVFGIVVTVVSIIVQLSAERYTGVARMFMRDRVNLTVMGYYIVTTVVGIWLSTALRGQFVPRASLVAMMAASTGGLVLMAPYFGYVFWFVEPMNVIRRISSESLRRAMAGARAEQADRVAAGQVAALSAMEELTDITSNSISGKDKIIASGAVDALKDLALNYLVAKPQASSRWFRIGSGIRENPDFVAMDPESLIDLERRRTWVEWKIMRQFLGIYNEALGSMRDINYLIAIDTRYIGEAAGRTHDRELIELVFRFMNSYLRATLNARDVRTAYNVMNQYRQLVEAMLKLDQGAAALEGVRHMLYYGHVSFDMKLTFVTETVAYDVSSVCQYAHELGATEETLMLEEFLELDRPLRARSQERALLGVRKAQVKLAAYYISKGDEQKARTICDDMREEPRDRLLQIREELERVRSKDFWEIIDRGRNFEYMPEEQRACLKTFFAWFSEARATA
jgi:hypothetical protein